VTGERLHLTTEAWSSNVTATVEPTRSARSEEGFGQHLPHPPSVI
jgi:hypothetical protein